MGIQLVRHLCYVEEEEDGQRAVYTELHTGAFVFEQYIGSQYILRLVVFTRRNDVSRATNCDIR